MDGNVMSSLARTTLAVASAILIATTFSVFAQGRGPGTWTDGGAAPKNPGSGSPRGPGTWDGAAPKAAAPAGACGWYAVAACSENRGDANRELRRLEAC